MRVGDIVQWSPSYLKFDQLPMWLGLVLEIKNIDGLTQARVFWFRNKDDLDITDWTPIGQLKKISTS
jgi:hypothetical protein